MLTVLSKVTSVDGFAPLIASQLMLCCMLILSVLLSTNKIFIR